MPEMHIPVIQGGHNDPYIDFMRFHLRDMERPETDEQDPAVVARCPEILKQALGLIVRFAGPEQLAEQEPVIATPRIGYETQDGLRGCIQLVGRMHITDPETQEFDLHKSHAAMHAGSVDERWLSGVVFVHGHKVYRNTFTGGLRAGSMGDLNYFQQTVERVQTAAFPKAKK